MLENLIPTVIWPNKSGTYNAVQVEVDGKTYLRFNTGYHGWSLSEALKEHGINPTEMVRDSHPTGMVEMGERRTIYTLPNPSGDRYRAIGMGFADIDIDKKEAEFHGHSIDYEIGIDKKALEKIAKLEPLWSIKTKD